MSFGGGGFGSGGFGSSNNNNNQSGGLFGGNSGGFGASNTNTTGFGSGAMGFGSNSNTSGSIFGNNNATNNNATSSGFGSGGFGSNTSNTGGSLFGGSNNATTRPGFGSTGTTTGGLFGNNSGSGGFGGSSGFGSTTQTNNSGGFGSNSGGGLFGNAGNTGFGSNSSTNNTASGGGLFGGTGNSSSPFGGGAGTGFGSSSGFGAATQNQGTGSTPFQAFIEADGGASSVKNHYQSIAFQDPYKNYSYEELRQVDYDQGRRFGNQNGQAGAFGQASTFGGQNTTSGFGQQTASSGFGGFGSTNNNPQATNTGFGGSSTGFGSNSGGGLFGQNKPATGGLFGSTATTTQSSGGGLFGTAGASNNTFGSNANSNNNSAFGNQSKGLFGGSSTTGGFGSTTQNTGGGLFGQQNNNSHNNQTSSFGGFGQQNNQAQNSGFGGFGANNNNNNNNAQQQKPLFGGSTAGGLFGQNNQQTNQSQSGSLFGNTGNQSNAGGGLFGAKPATGASLFGNSQNNTNNQSNSLFGGNNQNQQQGSGSLFGTQQNKPSLFGGSNTQNTGGSLFGGSLNTNANQQQQQPGGGLFGGSAQSQPAAGNSLFGNSQQIQQQSQQPQQLTASMLSANPYGNEHLFANLGTPQQPVGPLATPLSSSQKPRRPAPLPTYKINPAASTRLITPQKRQSYGFSYSTYGTPGSAYGSSPFSGSLLSPTFGRTLTKSVSAGSLRSTYGIEDSILNPNAFSPGSRSSRSSGSMKKLHINRSIRTDLFDGPSDGNRASPLKKAVSFDDDSGETLPDGGTSTALVRVDDSATPTAEEMGYLRSSASRMHGSKSATPEAEVNGKELATVPENQRVSSSTERASTDDTLAKTRRAHEDQPLGDYWMSPSMQELAKMTKRQLSSIEKFTVGRVGAGKVEFHNVDLAQVPLEDILTNIVRFAHRGVTVYADHDNKPEQGKGLNVPATVYLENSWPRLHGGRAKVFDKSGAKVDKHIERLRRIKDTDFVRFDNDNGTWVFNVQHFSTYELGEEEEDPSFSSSMMDDVPGSLGDAASPLAMKRGPRPLAYQGAGLSLFQKTDKQPTERAVEYRSSYNLPGGFDEDALVDALHTSEMSQVNHRLPPVGSMAALPDDVEQIVDAPMTSSHRLGDEFPPSVSSLPDLDGQYDRDEPKHTPTKNLSIKPRSILKTGHNGRSVFGTPSHGLDLLGEDNWAGQLQRTLSPKKQDRQALRDVQDALLDGFKPLQPVKAPIHESRSFATSMDVMDSLFGGKLASRNAQSAKSQVNGSKDSQWHSSKQSRGENANAEAVFHTSSKPRWTQDGMPLTSQQHPSDSAFGDFSQWIVPDRQDAKRHDVLDLPKMSRSFERQGELSIIDIQDGVPRATLRDTFSFADFASALNKDADSVFCKHEQTVWELAQILFDSQDPQADEAAERKKIFVQFWKSVVTSTALAHAEKAPNAEEKALAHLSGFDVWGATESLLDGDDTRLATLIAQIGGDQSMRGALTAQINEWRQWNVLSEIPARIRALYELLAGNVCTSLGKIGDGPENVAETFNISKKFRLDWRRAFGLRLWYATTLNEPVSQAVLQYEEDLHDGQEGVWPTPWFLASNISTGWHDPEPETRQDILWGLLHLYAHQSDDKNIDVEGIISPENTSGNPLDALLSFQLLQALKARGVIAPSAERIKLSDSLTETLTAQLGTHSATLQHALFAALHFSTADARASAIRSLLGRYAGAITDDLFAYLTIQLRIPAPWIYAAKAQHAVAVADDPAAQASFLLLAGDTKTAHAVLARAVAPACVIEERLPALRAALAPFRNSDAPMLAEWAAGGGMYADFAELVDRCGGSPAVASGARPRFAPGSLADVRRLVGRLRSVLPQGVAWQRLTLAERAAVCEMGDVCARVEAELEALRAAERGAAGAALASGAVTGRREDGVLLEATRLCDEYYARAQLAV